MATPDGRTIREERVEHERDALRQFLEQCHRGSPVAVETTGNWYWIVDEIEAGLMRLRDWLKAHGEDERGSTRYAAAGSLTHALGVYGGAPMPESVIAELGRRLPSLTLGNAYGATETRSPAALMPPGHTVSRADSVGRVVPCGELVVMDESGREVRPGQPGEVWIKGPMVVPGYWNDPEATASAFVDGFWRSGDVGSMDAEGYVRVFDRLKDMINRAGYKVYSVEVENVLMAHPDIVEAAVVGRPDAVLGERVHAVVVPRADADAATLPRALKAFCAQRLSDYKVPETFTVVPGPLARNANGKLLKTELRARLRELSRQERAADHSA